MGSETQRQLVFNRKALRKISCKSWQLPRVEWRRERKKKICLSYVSMESVTWQTSRPHDIKGRVRETVRKPKD